MRLRILAVDDEPEVLAAVKSMVESLGIEVQTASDSQEAVERIETEAFDGFLVDARMPNVDGFQLAKHIRSLPSGAGLPIVMLTGYDDVETMREGFRAGVTFFLGKPVTRERACGLVHALRGVMLSEKRRYARLPFVTTVNCRWGAFGEKRFVAESVNIGEGGMLLQPSGGTDKGQELALEFNVPGYEGPLRPKVQVVWREPPDRIGVEFIEIGYTEREAIRDYISGRVEG